MRPLRTTSIVITALSLLLLSQLSALGLSTREGIVDEKEIIAPSVRYIHYHRTLPIGRDVDIYVVKIRLDTPCLEMRPALEGGKIKSSAVLSDIAEAEGAIAAINGGFFFEQDGRKLPVGELIINGRLLSHSDVLRGSFIIDGDGEITFDVLTIDAYLNPGDYYEPIQIHAMNVPPGGMKDAVYIYNRYWGDSTPPGDGLEIAIEEGLVICRNNSGGTPIPEDGFVISFHGIWRTAAERFTDGLEVGLIYDFEGEKGTIRHMLTGGPMFIRDGWLRDFSDEYRFAANVLAPANRSCLCRTWNDEILFVCTRGAQLTYTQLAGILADLNVRDAIGLDGGGSSGMWIDGVGVPAPSRPVPNAVVLVPISDEDTDNNISTGGLWGRET